MVPMIVLAVAFLLFFNSLGLTRTFIGLFITHIVITLPYAVRNIYSSLQGLDPVIEKAARSLGATPLKVTSSIVLPRVKPGLLAAMLYCFILSFNNLTMVLFIGGGPVRTLPYEIFYRLEYGATPAIAALATLMVVFFLLVFSILDRMFGIAQVFGVRAVSVQEKRRGS